MEIKLSKAEACQMSMECLSPADHVLLAALLVYIRLPPANFTLIPTNVI